VFRHPAGHQDGTDGARQYRTSISRSLTRVADRRIVRMTAPSDSRIQTVPFAGTLPPVRASWMTVCPPSSR
jgi:hypothetical protein